MRILQLCRVGGLAVHSFQQLDGILRCQWLAASNVHRQDLWRILCLIAQSRRLERLCKSRGFQYLHTPGLPRASAPEWLEVLQLDAFVG